MVYIRELSASLHEHVISLNETLLTPPLMCMWQVFSNPFCRSEKIQGIQFMFVHPYLPQENIGIEDDIFGRKPTTSTNISGTLTNFDTSS
jgi:hypothetical protein